MHSDEGGRFLHSEGRYLVIEADDDHVPLDPPPGHLRLTPDQLITLVRHQSYVSVQARTLPARLTLGAVTWP